MASGRWLGAEANCDSLSDTSDEEEFPVENGQESSDQWDEDDSDEDDAADDDRMSVDEADDN